MRSDSEDQCVFCVDGEARADLVVQAGILLGYATMGSIVFCM